MNRSTAFFLTIKSFLFAVLVLIVIFLMTFFFSKVSNAPPLDALSADTSVNPPQVILDAGHGGADPGAISVLGQNEKDLNLSVTMKLGEFLEEAGIEVIYTRTNDVAPEVPNAPSRKTGDLLARVNIAKEHEKATFISIHMNTLPIEKYNGLQVFYTGGNGVGRAFAQSIQKEVARLLQPENHREAKDAKSTIYVLDRIGKDAVLIECGFISNYEEAKLLADEEYQERLAFVLSRSILKYVYEKGKI